MTHMSSSVAAGRSVHRVAVLIFDHPALFETAIACEVWGIDRTAMGVPPSEVRLCTPERTTLTTDLGARIDVDHGLEGLRWADTIVIPAARKPIVEPVVDDAVARALRAAYRRGARIATFCSGAFVLAATGLLAGRKATTHWTFADAFRERFPDVELDPNVLYVGGDRLFTSAGTAAGIDLCLHLVRRDHGADVANRVARRMVVAAHRDGGQAQFVDLPVPSRPADDPVAASMDWARGRLPERIGVDDLARHAHLSVRQFSRRFRSATGASPGAWLLRQRLDAALPLLESSDEPVERVAARVGFPTPAAFRRHFARAYGVPPSAWRRSFAER